MTTKHTPGPWIKHNGSIYSAKAKDGKFYAELAVAGVFAEEDVALIAAAPDLLAALQRMAQGWATISDENANVIPGLVEARAAIAKATRESQ